MKKQNLVKNWKAGYDFSWDSDYSKAEAKQHASRNFSDKSTAEAWYDGYCSGLRGYSIATQVAGRLTEKQAS